MKEDEPKSQEPPFDPEDIAAGIGFIRDAVRRENLHEAGKGLGVLMLRVVFAAPERRDELQTKTEHALNGAKGPVEQLAFEALLGAVDAARGKNLTAAIDSLPTVGLGEPFPRAQE